MPITYDPDTDTITVVGGTEAEPFSFEDIYQADINNGWNKVTKCGERFYHINANLKIGDDVNETWLKDLRCAVQIGTNTNGKKLEVRDLAHFELNESELIWYDYGVSPHLGVAKYSKCVLFRKVVETYVGGIKGQFIAEDCIIHMGGLYPWDAINFTLRNCLLYKTYLDLATTPEYISLEDIEFRDMTSTCIYVSRPQTTLYEPKFTNCTGYLLDLATSDASAIVIDPIGFDIAKIRHRYDTNITTVQHSFKVKVTDKDGNPVEGADVYLYDKNGNEVLHEVTDINGEIPLRYVPQYKLTGQGVGNDLTVEDFNPYTLVVEKLGYTKYESKITIDKPLKNLVVALNALYTKDELYENMKLIRKYLTNRWKIENNELLIFDDDNQTVIKRFKLYDKEGKPTETNVYDRVPV